MPVAPKKIRRGFVLAFPNIKTSRDDTKKRQPLRKHKRLLTLDIPPSTTKSVPFTNELSLLARKTTACASSIASPKRPVGKCISLRWRLAASSPSQSCRRAVLIKCNLQSAISQSKDPTWLNCLGIEQGVLERSWTECIESKSFP